MVPRGGFYTDGVSVICQTVAIDWNLGFDKNAKLEYIKRIQQALPSTLSPAVDVTTASPDPVGRSLSPIFILDENGKPFEETWQNNKNICVPGVTDFLYCRLLSETQKAFIRHNKCFIDCFYKPVSGRNTQACVIATYKLLNMQNKDYLLNDLEGFLKWYNEVGFYWLEPNNEVVYENG